MVIFTFSLKIPEYYEDDYNSLTDGNDEARTQRTDVNQRRSRHYSNRSRR